LEQLKIDQFGRVVSCQSGVLGFTSIQDTELRERGIAPLLEVEGAGGENRCDPCTGMSGFGKCGVCETTRFVVGVQDIKQAAIVISVQTRQATIRLNKHVFFVPTRHLLLTAIRVYFSFQRKKHHDAGIE
jgi:hypothetical protein